VLARVQCGLLRPALHRRHPNLRRQGRAAALAGLPSAVLDLTATPWVMAPGLYAPLADVSQAFLNGRFLWDRGFWLIDGEQMQYRPPLSPLPCEP